MIYILKGAYFAGPPLILQYWKGENQLFEMEDSTSGQPAAMVGHTSYLSRVPRAALVKIFLAGVNFFQF